MVHQESSNYFSEWLSIISIFTNIGGKFKSIKQKNLALPFKEYVVCFTGIRDKEFAKHLEDNGAIITESFNKKVNILITKDINSNSTKIIKAKEQGCLILTLEEAKKKFQ